jgi:peptidoglycan/LPS O-acetylase OafA/YrhL
MLKFKFDSIRSVMDRHGGTGPGFDFLRIALALAILYAHSFLVTGSKAGVLNALITEVGGAAEIAAIHRRPLTLLLVPLFFAISGFLVTGSAFRTRALTKFMLLRILRIVPALLTEVTLSALVLGPIFTTYALKSYFGDARFFAYFGNIVGRVRFELPGVFLSNPYPGVVNVNLWTLQPEFYCYLATAVLISTSLLFNRKVFTVFFIAATAALCGVNFHSGFGEPSGNYPASVVVYYFFCGSFLYHWRHFVPTTFVFFIIASVLGFVGTRFEGTVFLVPLLFTYAIVYLGMVELPRLPVLQSGDYSYGVYLYGFPIQQAIIGAFPIFIGHGWWMLGSSAVVTVAIAMMSWHFVEKPALRLKKIVEVSPQRALTDSLAVQTVLSEARGQARELAEP